MTPHEFGDQFMAQSDDMKRHAQEANASDISVTVGRDELQWMSQWSEEEELVSDQAMRNFRAPWEGRRYVAGGCALLLLAGFLHYLRSKAESSSKGDDWPLTQTKSHFV